MRRLGCGLHRVESTEDQGLEVGEIFSPTRKLGEPVVSSENVPQLLPLRFVARHEYIRALPVVQLLEIVVFDLYVQHDAFLVLAVALPGQFGQNVLLDSAYVFEFEYALVFADLDEYVLGLQFFEEVFVVDVSDLVEFAVFPATEQVLFGVVEDEFEGLDPDSLRLDENGEAVPLLPVLELTPTLVDELHAAVSQLLLVGDLTLLLDPPLQNEFIPEHLELFLENSALGAEVVFEAVAALGVTQNVVGVQVDLGALVADEGFIRFDLHHVLDASATFLGHLQQRLIAHLSTHQILVDFCAVVQ
jgi:hypothetical protein